MRRMLICLGAIVLLGCVSLSVAAAGPAQVAGKWTLKYGKTTHTLELTQDGSFAPFPGSPPANESARRNLCSSSSFISGP